MADTKNNLLLLLQKPREPLFTPRNGGQAVFDLPDAFFTDRYRTIGSEISTRFGETNTVTNKITLAPLTETPNLDFAANLNRSGGFSLFNEAHKVMAGKLTKIFVEQPDVPSLLSTAAYVRDRVNLYMFQYALTVAMQHRDDTKDLTLPSIVNLFPDQFIDPSTFPRAKEEFSVVSQEDRQLVTIPMEFTSSAKDIEQRMAYFREDIGVNLHHWHWHLVYPAEGPDAVVRKNRRGELFYYMHNQIIHRYNADRMNNGLERVRPLNNLRTIVPEAYFPKIIRSSDNRSYPARGENAMLRDLNRPESIVKLSDIERWRDNIYQAIDQGFMVNTKGQQVSLRGPQGIDILADAVEASALSPNKGIYGNMHNDGHTIIAYAHDPERKYLEDFAVMGDVTTAMRDPIFYRWHSFIDSVFQRHKNTLPLYVPNTEIAYNGIVVTSVGVRITRGKNPTPNTLLTFWQTSDVNLATGLDFGPEGNIYAEFTHLQNAPFEYTINVDNISNTQRIGTCRIFICPKSDERGRPIIQFEEQRHLMIEMDKFTVYMNPGRNIIRRRSDESSVTIPYEQSLRNIGSQAPVNNPAGTDQFNFCGCGWPQHMLLPKGTINGSAYSIFVMISNYELDRIDQPDLRNPCDSAASFCGLKDQLYPDRRAMGFPFDRPARVVSLLDFKNLGTNMAIGECTIRFANTIMKRQ